MEKVEDILKNEELATIINTVGASVGSDFDLDSVQYGKVIIMTDADTDGAHIQILLLTFFYRFMRPLIEGGHVYVANPPLYKITSGKKLEYAYLEEEKDGIIESFGSARVNIQRYKGLGEMNPEQLWETTMDPEVRLLDVITLEDAELADTVFETLMGDETEPRKVFIQQNAKYAELDI